MSHILVVDDEPDFLDFFSEELAERGFDVQTAIKGEEAIAKVRANPPDLVLLDMWMPGLDGVETLRRLKAIEPRLKVIMVTAIQDEQIVEHAMALGALDYITKPFELEYLNKVVMTKVIDVVG